MSDEHVEAVERPEPERTGLVAWVRTAAVCALLVAGLVALLPFMPAHDHGNDAVATTPSTTG